MLSKKKFILFTLLIFLFSLGVRVNYSISLPDDIDFKGDGVKYLLISDNLLKSKIYSPIYDATTHEVFITPGYPFFITFIRYIFVPDVIDTFSVKNGKLAVNKKILNSIYIAQILLSCLTVVIFFIIALSFLPASFAIIAAFIMAISPHEVVLTHFVLTETLFIFLLSLSLLFIIQAIKKQYIVYFILFGLFIGLAALVRPAILLFPFFLLLFLVFSFKINFFKVFIMLLFVILSYSPWLLWKQDKISNYSAAAASFAFGSYPNLVYKDSRKGYPYDEDKKYEEMQKSFKKSFEVISERVQQQPLTYLHWYLIGKPIVFWSWSYIIGEGPFPYKSIESLYSQNHWLMLTNKIVYYILLAFVFFVFIVELLRFFKSIQPEIIVLLGLLFYFTIIHIILASLPRYSVPIHFPMFLVGIWGIYQILYKLSQLTKKNE